MLVAMALIWAVNYSVLKFATRLVPPLAYNGVRIPAAALLQFGIARAMRLESDRRERMRCASSSSACSATASTRSFFILGQARSRVATTVLMLASGPALGRDPWTLARHRAPDRSLVVGHRAPARRRVVRGARRPPAAPADATAC